MKEGDNFFESKRKGRLVTHVSFIGKNRGEREKEKQSKRQETRDKKRGRRKGEVTSNLGAESLAVAAPGCVELEQHVAPRLQHVLLEGAPSDHLHLMNARSLTLSPLLLSIFYKSFLSAPNCKFEHYS